mgnify:CR=1 FL=1|jgi:hypothetical protein
MLEDQCFLNSKSNSSDFTLYDVTLQGNEIWLKKPHIEGKTLINLAGCFINSLPEEEGVAVSFGKG